jgi:cytochrome c-type biogenesis protein
MSDPGSISLGLAFGAGLLSFLSPCVLPIVPSYVSYVTGLTLEELQGGDSAAARRQAAVHSGLFILGFSALFVSLGASATAVGGMLTRALPLLQEVGGIVVLVFGLYMLGIVRIPALMQERRVHLAAKPAGKVGSVVAGAAFGAGWTPCIGPVLATILLYASLETTMLRGTLLLAVYALGLGLPFFVAAVGLNWFLAGTRGIRRWLGAVEHVTGAFLVLVGILMITGRFTVLSQFFAGLGQLVHLEVGA